MRVLGLVLGLQPWLMWPSAAHVDPYGAPRWLAGVLGLAAVAVLLAREGRPPRGGWSDPRSLMFGGALAIAAGLALSSLFSGYPLLGLRVGVREAFFATAAALMASASPPDRADWRWLAGCLLVSAALQSMLALAQAVLPASVGAVLPALLAPGGEGRWSLVGTFGNPEYLAGWLASGLAAAALLAMRGVGRLRIAAIAALALTTATIYLNGGRGAALSAAVAIPAAWFVFRCRTLQQRPDRRRRLIVALGIGAVAIVLLLALRPSGYSLPARLATLTDVQSESTRHRIAMVVVTSRMILERPLLGAGPGRFGAAFGTSLDRAVATEPGIGFWATADLLAGSSIGEAHCDPLQWWAEYGLLPVFGLTLMAAVAFGAPVVRRRSLPPEVAALWAAAAVQALNMWVSFPLHEPARAVLWWALLGLLAAGASTPHEPVQSVPEEQ